MKKHMTKLLAALLAIVMFLPVTAQAAPADGWTDEAEQAYQTLTEKTIQQVEESRDDRLLSVQQRNTQAVYALWISGAAVPDGFYDEYLQALASWLDAAAQRGRYAYIPTAIRTVAAMGLDVTDFAGHDLLDPLREPNMVTADEDRLHMLLDLSYAGDAVKTEEFAALRETLLTETLARQQGSGQFRYSAMPGTELRFNGLKSGEMFSVMRENEVAKYPDRFAYILLTAQSVQALAPYRDRKDVSAAVDKALGYLSEQQLPSGGFVRLGEENVQEDAAVLEMLSALGISLTDERFTKDDHTVLDGMMGWYQAESVEIYEGVKQGFYSNNRRWQYDEDTQTWGGELVYGDPDPNDPDYEKELAIRRNYLSDEAYRGLSAVRADAAVDKADIPAVTVPEAKELEQVSVDYGTLLGKEWTTMEDWVISTREWREQPGNVSRNSLSAYAEQILALEKLEGGELSESQKEELRDLMENLMGVSSEYLMGRTSWTFAPGTVRALTAIDVDPGDFYGLDCLAPLMNLEKMDQLEYAAALQDFDAVDGSVWRSRGVDVDTMVDKYAEEILSYQMPNGKFSNSYRPHDASRAATMEEQEALGVGGGGVSVILDIEYTAESLKALAPHQDKEYIANAVEKGLEYLSSIQQPDGTFGGNWGSTLLVADMLSALNIPLDDERFVKNGRTLEDALRLFYKDGGSFSGQEETPLSTNPYNPYRLQMVSGLAYLQSAGVGARSGENSVFEIVGSALTETPLGAILLAVIIAVLLAFGMIRRYRRIKKEQ